MGLLGVVGLLSVRSMYPSTQLRAFKVLGFRVPL